MLKKMLYCDSSSPEDCSCGSRRLNFGIGLGNGIETDKQRNMTKTSGD